MALNMAAAQINQRKITELQKIQALVDMPIQELREKVAQVQIKNLQLNSASPTVVYEAAPFQDTNQLLAVNYYNKTFRKQQKSEGTVLYELVCDVSWNVDGTQIIYLAPSTNAYIYYGPLEARDLDGYQNVYGTWGEVYKSVYIKKVEPGGGLSNYDFLEMYFKVHNNGTTTPSSSIL